MTHISYLIQLEPSAQEIEIANLNELGVDSFMEHDDALEAFIETTQHPELSQDIEQYLIAKRYSYKKIMHDARDWNAEWEKNFNPIEIGNDLLIRAPFHLKDLNVKHEVIIAPKMAFGTGHHETTSMMLEWMLIRDLHSIKVLDFGCGTGILGLLAFTLGAADVLFIDNDSLAVENTQENMLLNSIPPMEIKLGSYDAIPDTRFDLILANITRNILSQGMVVFSKHLKHKGIIAMSGFLADDLEYMKSRIQEAGLKLIEQRQKNDWLCLIAEKQLHLQNS